MDTGQSNWARFAYPRLNTEAFQLGTRAATVSVTVNTTNHMTTEQFNTLRAWINQAHRAIAQGQSLVSFVLHAHLNNRAIAKRGYRIALRELAMTPSYH